MKINIVKPNHSFKFILILITFLIAGCDNNSVTDVSITDEVLETQWKPKIRQAIVNHYNSKYMAPLASGGSDSVPNMLAMVNTINSMEITSLRLEMPKQSSSKLTFTLTNKSRFIYVNVTYTMDAGDIPDGVDSRKIKVIVKGFDQISRIENI